METDRVLRIPRADSPDEAILIKVSKSGSLELDLSFVATEGDNPYVGSLKTTHINKLRAKAYRGSDDEWHGILSYVFNQDENAIKSKDWTTGLEAVASVKSVDDDDPDDEGVHEILITIRKRIDSITQRLGSITLKQDDDQAIQLFDWAGIAVIRGNALTQEISSLRTKYQDAERTINQLSTQLEELIQAKKDHDEQLIAKFALLLNEKKLKIRNQQRLLATAKLDPIKVAELEKAVAAKKSRNPTASRKSKRKDVPSDSESEDAFDPMDVDTEGKEKVKEAGDNAEDQETATESDRGSTPEPLEDAETASEEEEPAGARVEEPAPLPSRGKGRSAGLSGDKIEKGPSRPAAPKPPSSPPPRRELPFARRGGASKPVPATENKPDENDVETESDDEL
ncbi:hypothetical protein LOZ66_000437 [Ophidiomyces ophidiicola]|nr:hypothetical protein LOZ66_000437 [Ophidiomyces ophidiicola]